MCTNYSSFPTIFVVFYRIIFPAMCKLLLSPSTKGDIRVGTVEVLKSMQHCVAADKIWQWTEEPKLKEEIKRVTGSF
jgi:hypothetical protein